MLSTSLLLTAALVVGQAEEVVAPEKAISELGYLVGNWKVEGRVGDEKFLGKQSVKWSPGKHCLITSWTGTLGNTAVHGTAVLGWDASEEQIVDAGFIDTVGHRITRWTIETDKVWEGEMRGFLLGGDVTTAVRLEKESARKFVVVINAADEMPENEYGFTKIAKASRPKKKSKETNP